jgi:hypothetical protein
MAVATYIALPPSILDLENGIDSFDRNFERELVPCRQAYGVKNRIPHQQTIDHNMIPVI